LAWPDDLAFGIDTGDSIAIGAGPSPRNIR
jgi:hypothetical protein